MALTVYTPTVDEIMAALGQHLAEHEFLMLVAITDDADPNWRGGDHINFRVAGTEKGGWILEGSNGQKVKLTGKLIEPKKKKTEPIEPPTPTEAPPPTPTAEPTPPTP